MKTTLVVTTYFMLVGCSNAFNAPIARIASGLPAQRHEFPYIVSIHLNGQHSCGGSIITKTWILTAGQCIVGSTSQMSIYAGILYQGENHPDVQLRSVKQTIVHPSFRGGESPNDIALIELTLGLTWTAAVLPISLPQRNQEFSGFVWTAGWGYLSSNIHITPARLQKAQMRILTYAECVRRLVYLTGTSYSFDNNSFCSVGAYIGIGTVCDGDSGGPLVQNGLLVGIISWTLNPCGVYGVPSVSLKVSHYIDFISKYVPDIYGVSNNQTA